MIGKPHWFKRRKYTGWGFCPATWQGWVYIAVMILPFIIFHALPFWSSKVRTVGTIVWLIIFGIDAIQIMVKLKKDEREKIHEAIAERNVAWFMILVLAIGIAYETASGAVQQKITVDPFIVIALFGGLLVKIITNVYLGRKA